MRVLAHCCVFSLIGSTGSAHQEGFSATGPATFLYSEDDDGVAERMRRDWIAIALAEYAMCAQSYVVDTRRFGPDAVGPFGNGGDILYAGRCL
jgi:hypothetical protein